VSVEIGILRPGSTFLGMIERFGDYDDWFARALAPAGARTSVYDVTAGPPPSPDTADGWLITGSRSSVTVPEPWAEHLFDWIREAAGREAPVLGVCYGHQVICAALGGTVARHAHGWEIGTVEIELTEAGRRDPLFKDFPDRFLVQSTHEDHVESLPPGAAVLAGNDHSPIQAAAIGSTVRTVQFHPEVTTPIAADFVAQRRHLLAHSPAVAEAPWGARVLTNFLDLVMERTRGPQTAAGR
jgi:GMP synthase (glutamine-hydrolysing)